MKHAHTDIREARVADIETLRQIADRTWRACYPGIISIAQIDHMLGWMYAAEKIRTEMTAESIRYLIAEADGVAAGFAAHGPGAGGDERVLHKLYVLPEQQRRGIGSALLDETERQARAAGAGRLCLRVNRANHGAITAYQRHGFTITRQDLADIGGGFVMDDHIMTKIL